MRCNTPGMRTVSSVVERNGKFFSKMPSANRISARVSAWRMISALDAPCRRRLAIEKGSATPTMKRKNGKIQSVGVAPCHGTCWSAA